MQPTVRSGQRSGRARGPARQACRRWWRASAC